jgi:hypothetical protein
MFYNINNFLNLEKHIIHTYCPLSSIFLSALESIIRYNTQRLRKYFDKMSKLKKIVHARA